MTRAKDLLILSGSVSPQSFNRHWVREEHAPPPPLHKARSLSDWLGAWFCETIPQPAPTAGENDLVRWQFHDDRALMAAPAGLSAEIARPPPLRSRTWRSGRNSSNGFARPYPFGASTRLPAKTSVSALRQRTAPGDDDQSYAAAFPPSRPRAGAVRPARPPLGRARLGGHKRPLLPRWARRTMSSSSWSHSTEHATRRNCGRKPSDWRVRVPSRPII